jgi:hypothetical protein
MPGAENGSIVQLHEPGSSP